jgi:pilus assembly protein Flp/PilA
MMVALFSSEEGQGLVEYALILVLVAVMVVAIISTFGDRLAMLYTIVTALQPLE